MAPNEFETNDSDFILYLNVLGANLFGFEGKGEMHAHKNNSVDFHFVDNYILWTISIFTQSIPLAKWDLCLSSF